MLAPILAHLCTTVTVRGCKYDIKLMDNIFDSYSNALFGERLRTLGNHANNFM